MFLFRRTLEHFFCFVGCLTKIQICLPLLAIKSNLSLSGLGQFSSGGGLLLFLVSCFLIHIAGARGTLGSHQWKSRDFGKEQQVSDWRPCLCVQLIPFGSLYLAGVISCQL